MPKVTVVPVDVKVVMEMTVEEARNVAHCLGGALSGAGVNAAYNALKDALYKVPVIYKGVE